MQLEAGKKKAAPNPLAETPFSWTILKSLGKRYLGLFPALVAVYLALSLVTQSLIPVSITILSSTLTGKYPSGAPQHNANPSDTGNATGSSAPKTADTTPADTAKKKSVLGKLSPHVIYYFWAALLASMWGLNLLTRYIQTAFDAKAAQKLRYDLFGSIIRESPNFFIEYDKNRLNQIVNQIATQAQVGLRLLLIEPILQVIGILFSGWVLFGQILLLKPDPTTWIFLAAIGVLGLCSPWVVILVGKNLQRAASDVQEQVMRLSTLVGNALTSPEEIQAMQAEPFFDRKHLHELEQIVAYRLHQTFVMERLNTINKIPSDLVLMSLMGLLVFFLGSAGGVSAQNIVILFLLTPQFMGQVQTISSYFINRDMVWPSISTVNFILSRKSEIIESPQAVDIKSIDGSLEAKDVVFSYRAGVPPPVLNNFSLKVPAGKWTGFVARSGSGKSTFFRLVLRFFDFQAGEILVGGHPIKDFTLSSLRRHVSLMVQAPAFVYDTLRENMRIANPDATDEQIQKACRLTRIWDILVARLGANPLEQELAGANMLSGGQKRRLALARALLRNPSIILMDEPTVGLSPDDKYPLIPTLREACAGKTVLLVEQDILWLEQTCDYIFVMDSGVVVQQGTPDELRSQGGLYVQLRDSNSKQNDVKKEKSAQETGSPALVK